MAKQRPRRLVIDADIVNSASEAKYPISSTCRRFLDTVLDVGHHQDQQAMVAKDVHLVEAALATDQLITSRDERVRNALRTASNNAGELKRIVWVNPTQEDETPIDWLRDGVKTEGHRLLGS